jgi:hypothetical protein
MPNTFNLLEVTFLPEISQEYRYFLNKHRPFVFYCVDNEYWYCRINPKYY